MKVLDSRTTKQQNRHNFTSRSSSAPYSSLCELAAKQLEMLLSDRKLATCCLFLDCSKQRIPIPDEYRIYFEKPGPDYFVHEWNALAGAMRPESESGSFPFPQVLYRDCFDHFLAYLELVNHYLSIGLFSLRDVSS
jgi:hypothetical protein